jgi:hypothetical protein
MSSIIQFVSEDSAPNPEHENTFHFVIADPSTNLKPGRDPAIRSHCMQGKNRRDGSRRSQRDKKKKEAGKAIVVRKPSSGLESNIPRPLDSWSLMQFPSLSHSRRLRRSTSASTLIARSPLLFSGFIRMPRLFDRSCMQPTRYRISPHLHGMAVSRDQQQCFISTRPYLYCDRGWRAPLS